ncbi:hypothetical protein Tco_0186182 [Tanacetum coccineum]
MRVSIPEAFVFIVHRATSSIGIKWMKSSKGWLLEISLLEIDGKELYPWKLTYPDGICVLKELSQLQEKERLGQSICTWDLRRRARVWICNLNETRLRLLSKNVMDNCLVGVNETVIVMDGMWGIGTGLTASVYKINLRLLYFILRVRSKIATKIAKARELGVLKTRDVEALDAGKQTYPIIQRLMLEAACKKNLRPSADDLLEDLAPNVTYCWKEDPNARPNLTRSLKTRLGGYNICHEFKLLN